jgi:glucose/arabinose dehydrogenase
VATPLLIPDAVRQQAPADRLRRFEGRTVAAPAGVVVSIFAVLRQPRFAAFGPTGDLYVVDERLGHVVVLPDRDRDGVADASIVFAEGLRQPHSVAFAEGAVFVGETDGVRRLIDRDGDGRADDATRIISLPAGRGHWSRTVVVGPDNKRYVSVGSSCNVCIEDDWRRAAVLQYNLDGSGERLFARGLRNSVGLAWQPDTGLLYATENGRDHLGNDAPPEEVNIITDGADYGWPRCHGADIADPEFGRGPDACRGQTAPVITMQAHSAPLGLAFAPTAGVPVIPARDLVIAYHGSWNRTPATGYKLVRAIFQGGQPTGEVVDLVTGFRVDGGAWSRPVGVAFASDGALFVTDDAGGAIFRIAPATATP